MNIRHGLISATLAFSFLIVGCSNEEASSISITNSGAQDNNLAQLIPQVSALNKQLARVGDVNEIKRLQRMYGYYLDRSNWDDIVDLMTDGATAEYALGGVYEGKEQIRALLYGIGYGELGLQAQQLREHLQMQPVITLSEDGETAHGRWRVLAILGQYQDYARWQTGPYEMEYKKENGVWKINKLHWVEDFTVPFEGGWATMMEQTNVADRNLPESGSPTSFEYEPWPNVSMFPFHFENPVTEATSNETTAVETDSSIELADLQQELATLQNKAQLLEDEKNIGTLQRTYGYYVDKNLWEQIGDLFADDGTLEIGGRGIFVGPERALEYLQWLGEPVEGRLYDHTQMQGVVNVSPDGRTAKGRWRALVFGGDLDRSSIFGDCIYENEYEKVDGVWKITKLHAYFIMYTDLENGWANLGWANTRPEVDLPPDLPPTTVYDMYPGVITAPYHYENPITGNPVFPALAIPALESSDLVELSSLVSDLSKRTGLLEDAQEVERLQNAFGYYFDKRQWDDVSDLFAVDGTMERGQRGVYVGKERVSQSLSLYGEEGIHYGNVHQNLLYQPIIHIAEDGQTANGRFRTLNLHGDYEGEATLGGGVFENTYSKVDGVWQIQSDHLYTTFTADYDGGWSHGSLPVAGQSTELPPDLPPTLEYEAFPTYYTVPFHYENPVTGNSPLPE